MSRFLFMKVQIKTRVNKDFKHVFQRFDIHLFMKLKPPFIGLSVIRFDGCKTGDIVHVEINILGMKQKWISEITEYVENSEEIYFVDEGKVLPKPLRYWKHKHVIQKSIDSSVIIDDISYSTNRKILDFLLFPLFFLQFFYRKPVYKSYFRK